MNSQTKKPKIAWLHRFGAAEHTELFHALPEVIENLARDYEVHFYGFSCHKPMPELIKKHAILHEIPIYTDRRSAFDIQLKLLIWTMLLPFIALWCRIRGFKLVYLDEGVPFFGIIMLTFFGSRTVMTVADFYTDIYLSKNAFTRFVGKVIDEIDFFAWKRLKLVCTRANYTGEFLVKKRGFIPERIQTIYDPCDFDLYHPVERSECKKDFGYDDRHFLLVCHGILHPNKNVGWLVRAFAAVKDAYPQLRLMIVGDGVEGSMLRKMAQDLGVADKVQFTGWLPGSREVNRAINAGDVGVIMRIGNDSDNFHITGGLVHNMCCAVPSMSVRLKGIQEIIQDGENGFLFGSEHLEEFRQKLDRLVSDPALRKQFSERSYAQALQMFSNEKVAALLAGSLAKVASPGKNPH